MARGLVFCGQSLGPEELAMIRRVVAAYPRLSRTELASTVCELLEWARPNGRLKTLECRQFLESLHEGAVVGPAVCTDILQKSVRVLDSEGAQRRFNSSSESSDGYIEVHRAAGASKICLACPRNDRSIASLRVGG